MSVRPVAFLPDGSIDVVMDETGHSGTISATDIKWATGIDGTDNHSFIVLNCPDGCGASSTHPVGGGAAPLEIQQMFVNKVDAEGCACGNVDAAASATLGESHVKLNVARMDGADRWALG